MESYGFLAQDDPLSRAVEIGVKEAATAAGLQYAGGEFAPIGTVDWSVPITNLKAKAPDLVYILGGANASQVVKQTVDQGLAPYLQLPGFRPEDVGVVGNLRNTTIISVDWRQPLYRNATPSDLVDDVESLGTLQGGTNLQTGFAISYHDFMYLLKQAIEKAGTVTGYKAIAQALVGQRYEGPFGTAVINPDHSTSGPTGIIAISASDWKVFVFAKVGDTTPSQTFNFKTADVLAR